MDPLSQGALGAAAAVAIAPPARARWAALLGAIAGMAPDLDVLIRSERDPLLFLEVHRQFTHSLVFVPIGGLLCAGAAWWPLRARLRFAEISRACLAGFATHGLLDACTSYGTQLLWPFSTLRIAWNQVSVVDPLFTVPLLGCVLVAALRERLSLARMGLVWVAAYLALGAVQRERAEAFAVELARERGDRPLRLAAKPAFGNLLLWKSFYETQDRYQIDALRLGLGIHHYPGDHTPRLEVARDLPWLRAGSRQASDLERFRWFSDGFVALDPSDPHRVIDVRYSMLPDRIDALWGIVLDADAPADAHARFFTSRDAGPAQRAKLLGMLVGP